MSDTTGPDAGSDRSAVVSAQDAFGYFEHDADVGVIGKGETPELAMEQAAIAMFSTMGPLPRGEASQPLEIAFEESDIELALVTWLNRLLAECRINRLMPGRFRLVRRGSGWHGTAWGQPWDDTMDRGVEVKGATLTALSVTHRDGTWEARCVVDV